MLSVGGTSTNLGCADCKSSFSSASLLLRHFAEHITEKNIEESHTNNASISGTARKRSKVSLLQEEKKKRSESILEAVLRQSVDQNVLQCKSSTLQTATHNSNTSSSSSSVHSSKSAESETDVKNVSVHSANDMVVEIGQRAKEKMKYCSETTLIKFDLQKRLENCVSRLALKQGTSESKHSTLQNSLLDCASPNQDSEVQNCVDLPTRPNVNKNGDVDDFNPIKYCIVTLDESEDKLEECDKSTENGSAVPRPSKGASNRKQQMPKKIRRPVQADNSIIQDVRTSDSVTLPDEKVCQKTTGKKKYQCHVCSKLFGWSTDLKRHILTHTGERPFKCQMCEATFTRNFLLQKHESRVHSLASIDNKCSQEDDDSEKPQSDKNDLQGSEIEKIPVSGKKRQFKFWKNNNSVLNNSVKNSLTLRLDKTQELCDKYSSKKRKLPCDGASFDLFPQKVFNIL